MSTVATPTESVLRVARAQLIPCPLNPRTRFEESALEELGASLREKGVIQPLLARANDRTGLLEIVDGERRWRAAQRAGVDELPVIVRDLSDSDVLEIAIVSAVQRQGLTPLEEAAGYRRLIDSSPSLYSARYIADRIGRHEKYVWDRMKLLDLVDEAKQLLNDERILVGHAELLARLKPDDQRRAIDPQDGGLFERTAARLEFRDDDDEYLYDEETDDTALDWSQFKPRSVRELEHWIAHHVRFDVEHFAVAAPLDFGPVSDQVAEAAAKPGRGKKVISITHEYHVDDAAKAESERTFGPRSWRRADGLKQSEACEHAILGVIVAGPDYGQAFNVCIARDKCVVHWKEEIAEKQRNAELRAKGKGKQAAKRELSYDQKHREQERVRQERNAAWQALRPHVLAEALAQVKDVKTLTAAHGKALEGLEIYSFGRTAKQLLGPGWLKTPVAAILACAVEPAEHVRYDSTDPFADYIREHAKPFGLDIKRLEAVRDRHQREVGALELERKIQGGAIVQKMRGVGATKASTKKASGKKVAPRKAPSKKGKAAR